MGDGASSTVLAVAAVGTSFDVVTITADDVTVEKLAIDGSAGTGGTQDGISSTDTVLISQVLVENMRDNGISDVGNDSLIERSTFRNNTDYGIYVNGPTHVKIIGNLAHNNTIDGMRIANASYTTVTDNVARDNTGDGVNFDNSYYFNFDGNEVINNSGEGVGMGTGSGYGSVANNTFDDNAGGAIIGNFFFMSVTANHIDTSGVAIGGTGAGAGFNNSVVGNVIEHRSAAFHTIKVGADAVVSDNRISHAGTASSTIYVDSRHGR